MSRTMKFFQKGYHHDEIEEFLKTARSAYEGTGGPASFGAAQVRTQGFCIVHGGYNFAQVDTAMDRLGSAFVAHARADHVAVNGQEAWVNLVSERATTLYPRLLHPARKQFSHPRDQERDCRSVDVSALLEYLVAYFDGNKPLTSRETRDTVFAKSRGTRAYAEGPVDAYLARAVEVLLVVK